jgi:hypothetical protein
MVKGVIGTKEAISVLSISQLLGWVRGERASDPALASEACPDWDWLSEQDEGAGGITLRPIGAGELPDW